MARAVAVWDARKVWAYDGATSGTAWLAHQCELSRSSAATLVRTARRLESMPTTRAATHTGEIGFAKAVLLASAAHRSDKTLEVFAQHEAVLVDHARRLTVDQTAQMLQHWLLKADPDGAGGGAGDGDKLHVSSTFAGTTALDALYTSDDGEVVRAAIAHEYERLWRAERASNGPTWTPAQRRAAALAEIARRAMGAQVGRPTIAVTIPFEDLEARSGTGRVDETGAAVSAETARRLACDARIVPIVLDGRSEPMDVGRASRRDHPRTTTSTDDPRPRVCVPRLRPSAWLVRWPPHRALGRRRPHRLGQPCLPVRSPPQGHARGRLDHGESTQRHPHLHPSRRHASARLDPARELRCRGLGRVVTRWEGN